jgi:hypothetical protein
MELRNVLILGRQDLLEFPKAIRALGCIPITRGSVIQCYKQLKSEAIYAVIVECNFTHADVLEFILNVRDLDRSVPIIVVGQSSDQEVQKKLATLESVYMLSISLEDQKQTDKLEAALKPLVLDQGQGANSTTTRFVSSD